MQPPPRLPSQAAAADSPKAPSKPIGATRVHLYGFQLSRVGQQGAASAGGEAMLLPWGMALYGAPGCRAPPWKLVLPSASSLAPPPTSPGVGFLVPGCGPCVPTQPWQSPAPYLLLRTGPLGLPLEGNKVYHAAPVALGELEATPRTLHVLRWAATVAMRLMDLPCPMALKRWEGLRARVVTVTSQ